MTPLEIERKNQEESKTKPLCCTCPKCARVGDMLFCTAKGKGNLCFPCFEILTDIIEEVFNESEENK